MTHHLSISLPTPIRIRWHHFTCLCRPFLMSFHSRIDSTWPNSEGGSMCIWLLSLIVIFNDFVHANRQHINDSTNRNIEFLYIIEYTRPLYCDISYEYWTEFILYPLSYIIKIHLLSNVFGACTFKSEIKLSKYGDTVKIGYQWIGGSA